MIHTSMVPMKNDPVIINLHHFGYSSIKYDVGISISSMICTEQLHVRT